MPAKPAAAPSPKPAQARHARTSSRSASSRRRARHAGFQGISHPGARARAGDQPLHQPLRPGAAPQKGHDLPDVFKGLAKPIRSVVNAWKSSRRAT